MTIKIQVYQKQGIKSDKIEDEYEFCCWSALRNWLIGYRDNLYICKDCKIKQDANAVEGEQ